MSTIYMSQLSTALPLMEGGGDHHHHHHHQDHHHRGHFQAFTLPAKNPPNLFPFVISSSNPIDGGGYGSDHPHHLRQQHHAMLDQQPQHMIGGSSSVFLPLPTVESIRDDMIERSSSFEPYSMEKLHGAASGSAKDAGKWPAAAASAPAKMRITRKASDPGVVVGPASASAKKPRRRAQQAYDEGYSHSGGGAMNHALGVIRTCSDCSTTKTPLWRSGPRGPKSLCNACGIRQRKARRALMASGAAAAASTGGGPTATPSTGGDAAAARPKAKKEKIRVDVDRSLPFKKRCKVVQDHGAAAPVEAAGDPVAATAAAAAAPARDLAENMAAVKWCKSPTSGDAAAAACLRPSAAQDEITDAAMLLMTLSCASDRSRIRDAIRDVPPQAFFLPY